MNIVRRRSLVLSLAGILSLGALPVLAMDSATCPLHAQHTAASQTPSTHHDAVDHRGNEAMGFDHRKTRHVFTFTEGGGVIRVRVLDPGDVPSLVAIRAHLALLPEAFSQGDFSMPMDIHGVLPPGAGDMSRLRAVIRYAYAENSDGGEVRLTSDDPAARRAIHEFLRFQIEDHRTGDPTTVEEK